MFPRLRGPLVMASMAREGKQKEARKTGKVRDEDFVQKTCKILTGIFLKITNKKKPALEELIFGIPGCHSFFLVKHEPFGGPTHFDGHVE